VGAGHPRAGVGGLLGLRVWVEIPSVAEATVVARCVEATASGKKCRGTCERVLITEMNRMCTVLFDMDNRIFGPYLATTHRIPLFSDAVSSGEQGEQQLRGRHPSRIDRVGLPGHAQLGAFGPYLAAATRDPIQ
jgi:hypothetical protein